ncbi:hypothetical protein CEXT_782221, partial [Caerostris extrusa]
MGDADSQIQDGRRVSENNIIFFSVADNPGLDAEQMTRVLDALDQDITNLHQTVHDLEDRTLRA